VTDDVHSLRGEPVQVFGRMVDGVKAPEKCALVLQAMSPIDAEIAQEDHFERLRPPRLTGHRLCRGIDARGDVRDGSTCGPVAPPVCGIVGDRSGNRRALQVSTAAAVAAAGLAPLVVVELAYRPNTVVTRSLREDLRRSRIYAERIFGVNADA